MGNDLCATCGSAVSENEVGSSGHVGWSLTCCQCFRRQLTGCTAVVAMLPSASGKIQHRGRDLPARSSWQDEMWGSGGWLSHIHDWARPQCFRHPMGSDWISSCRSKAWLLISEMFYASLPEDLQVFIVLLHVVFVWPLQMINLSGKALFLFVCLLNTRTVRSHLN